MLSDIAAFIYGWLITFFITFLAVIPGWWFYDVNMPKGWVEEAAAEKANGGTGNSQGEGEEGDKVQEESTLEQIKKHPIFYSLCAFALATAGAGYWYVLKNPVWLEYFKSLNYKEIAKTFAMYGIPSVVIGLPIIYMILPSSTKRNYIEPTTAPIKKSIQTFLSSWRSSTIQFLSFILVFLTALVIWKSAMVYSGSDSPVVVVLSASMEPAFRRGDVLFLTDGVKERYMEGDIVVFKIEGREIPIVHRILNVYESSNGTLKYLTKGDNNHGDDRTLYNKGQYYIQRESIVGKVSWSLPRLGWFTLMLNDYPALKVVFIVCVTIIMYLTKDTTFGQF